MTLSLSMLACGSNPPASPDAGATDAAPADAASGNTYTVFLNRGGGTYEPGMDDPANNKTGILRQTLVAAPFSGGDVAWNDGVACLRQTFAAYRIGLVESDPGAALAHMEVAVIQGTSDQAGLPAGLSSINATSCFGPVEGIAFVFDNEVTGGQDLCAEVSFSIAKMFGLDNVRQCDDISAWRWAPECNGITDVVANDLDMTCGETESRSCSCGGATVNSHQVLADVAGLRP